MTTKINNSAVTLFDTTVKKVYQEGYSLRGLVREKSILGAQKIQFPVLGKAVARTKAIHADVVPADVSHDPVVATVSDHYAADYTDIFKNKQINFDEVTELATVLKDACGRKADKILIDAMVSASGTATVSNDIGGTDTDMNFDKFIEAMGALDDAGVPADGRTFLMNHRAYRQLLSDEKFTSSDYGQARFTPGSSQGNVVPYLGFNIVTIAPRVEIDGTQNGLPTDGSNDTTLLAFHRDAVGIGFNMDITSEVNYIPEKLAFLSTVMFSAGAVAIDPTGIVKITARQA